VWGVDGRDDVDGLVIECCPESCEGYVVSDGLNGPSPCGERIGE